MSAIDFSMEIELKGGIVWIVNSRFRMRVFVTFNFHSGDCCVVRSLHLIAWIFMHSI